jgi:hypothetical protein
MGHPVIAMARNARKAGSNLPAGIPIRIADYDDRASLDRALEGVTDLLFIASDGDGREVMRHHANVIDAAGISGVEHIAFTSIIDVDEASPFCFTPVYRNAERRLAELDATCTVLSAASMRTSCSRIGSSLRAPRDNFHCPWDRPASPPFRATMWRRQRLRQSPRAATPAKSTS